MAKELETRRPVITVEPVPGHPELVRIGWPDPGAFKAMTNEEVGELFAEAWQGFDTKGVKREQP